MAFTRKMLKALGIEEEKIEQIMDAHVEVVNGLKEQADSYKADAEKLVAVQNELDTLKAAPDYKKQFDDLKAEYDGYKNQQAEAQANAGKKAAVRNALKAAGVQREGFLNLLAEKVDLKTVELDGDKIKDTAFIDGLKNDFADCFATVNTVGANKIDPPTGGATSVMTKEDIMKIKNPAERQKAISENMAAFGYE